MDDFADVCAIDQHAWQVNFFQHDEHSAEVKEKLIDLFVEAYFLNQNPFILDFALCSFKFNILLSPSTWAILKEIRHLHENR